MLIDERDPYITEGLLNNKDVIGQRVGSGPNEGAVLIPDDVADGSVPLPTKNEYITEPAESDEPGERIVVFGPNEGKVVVAESEWESMDEGRASLYVPEDELEEYDLESGTGDLCLPQPTSDRDRLQSHKTFWKYIGQQFGEQFDKKVDEVYERIDSSNDPLDAIMDLDPEEMVVNPEGFKAE
jgi:hypothetical protein